MKKVLIVDDSAMVRRQVGNALKTAAVEAVDGQDARDKLAATPSSCWRLSQNSRAS